MKIRKYEASVVNCGRVVDTGDLNLLINTAWLDLLITVFLLQNWLNIHKMIIL
jgi:hypothetical protein